MTLWDLTMVSLSTFFFQKEDRFFSYLHLSQNGVKTTSVGWGWPLQDEYTNCDAERVMSLSRLIYGAD